MGAEIWNSVCLYLLRMLGISIDTAEMYGMAQSPSKKAQQTMLKSVAGMARKVPGVLRWAGEVGVLCCSGGWDTKQLQAEATGMSGGDNHN